MYLLNEEGLLEKDLSGDLLIPCSMLGSSSLT